MSADPATFAVVTPVGAEVQGIADLAASVVAPQVELQLHRLIVVDEAEAGEESTVSTEVEHAADRALFPGIIGRRRRQ